MSRGETERTQGEGREASRSDVEIQSQERYYRMKRDPTGSREILQAQVEQSRLKGGKKLQQTDC